ncbi:MAG: ureidoglycolate lyase [Snowella sp.]|nr:ureidoglycolate lyase [Snowella sp.]
MGILQRLVAQTITAEAFKPYGQLILPSDDGKGFDESDAQLDLSQGTPRFYIMRLPHRGRCFHKITRHVRCTQCLGSLGGKYWFLAVCPPSEALVPDLSQMRVFQIFGDRFVKLEKGTWHAGPYFDEPSMDFYNLELSNTNVIDHFTHDFLKSHELQFEIV